MLSNLFTYFNNILFATDRYIMPPSNGCQHRNVYVKEIYEQEKIHIDMEAAKNLRSVPFAIEYLSLVCYDCYKIWYGKRTIHHQVELRIGNSSNGATGYYIPKTFIELNPMECSHSKFKVIDSMINFIDPLDYLYDDEITLNKSKIYPNIDSQILQQSDQNNDKQLWAHSRAECKHCATEFNVKRNYIQNITADQMKENKFPENSKWERCKVMLK